MKQGHDPSLYRVEQLNVAGTDAEPFCIIHKFTGRKSQTRYWTRRSATHAMKSGHFKMEV